VSLAVATWKLYDIPWVVDYSKLSGAPWVIDNAYILDGRPFCIPNEISLNMPAEYKSNIF
jgi:hypothetical protein